MDRILKIGEEVLIFTKAMYIKTNGSEKFIRGKVLERAKSGDLSHHGSPWNIEIYKVLGEDGKIYKGAYEHPLFYDSYFYTREDYIKHLNCIIKINNLKINELYENNLRIQEVVDSLQPQKNKQLNLKH